MANKKTLKENYKRFCHEYVFGENWGNATRCFVASHPHSSSIPYATVRSSQLMKNPIIRAEIDRLKNEAGLNDKFITQKILDGFNANVVAVFRGKAYETNIPDYSVRHKYIETAAKLLNLFPAQQTESKSINIDVQLEKLPQEELVKLLNSASKKKENGESIG